MYSSFTIAAARMHIMLLDENLKSMISMQVSPPSLPVTSTFEPIQLHGTKNILYFFLFLFIFFSLYLFYSYMPRNAFL